MEDFDFYRICVDSNGNKYIDPQCFFYFTDDDEKPGRCVNYHQTMYLKDFLAMSPVEQREWLDETVKYIDDLTEEETYEWYDKMFEEYHALLPYKDIKLETPVGAYHSHF